MGYLLCHKTHQMGVLGGTCLWGFLCGVRGGIWILGYLPGAVECLTNDGVVRLLGNGTLAAFMERGEVVLYKPNHALLRAAAVSDGHKEVGV